MPDTYRVNANIGHPGFRQFLLDNPDIAQEIESRLRVALGLDGDAEEAEGEGIKLVLKTVATRILGETGHVTGMECAQSRKLSRIDEHGTAQAASILQFEKPARSLAAGGN